MRQRPQSVPSTSPKRPPEVVAENNEGVKGVAYSEIIPVLIEAIKEQQGKIDKLEKSLAELKAER
jgi:hypothetical protein